MYEEFSKIFSNLALLHKSLRNSEVSFFPLKKQDMHENQTMNSQMQCWHSTT